MAEQNGCVKCGHTEVEEGTLSATGSGLYLKYLIYSIIILKRLLVKTVVTLNFIKTLKIIKWISLIYSLVKFKVQGKFNMIFE